jgi:signal peptidase
MKFRRSGTLTTTIERCVAVIGASLLLVIAAGLLLARERGTRLLSVQTGSMEPTLRPGDAVIVETIHTGSLRPGDIVNYRSPRASRLVITHRLISIDAHGGWLTTEGDALDSPDPPFPRRLVVGRVRAVAPRLGVVLDTLRHPVVLIVVLYVPAAVVIFTELHRLGTAPKGSYRLRDGR